MSLIRFDALIRDCREASSGSRCGAAANGHWPAGTEPAVDDILADPLVHLVMRRDGVSMSDLQRLVATVRAGLAS